MGLDSKRKKLKHKTLDEIIETMRTNGVLKTKQYVSLGDNSKATGEIAGTHTNGGIPPIVIIKPQNSPCWKKEEDNVSSYGCTLQKTMEESGAKRFEMETNEAAQKGKAAVATSQKQLNRAVAIREGKRAEDIKKQVVQGKKQMERKTGKTIAEPIKINSTAKITPEKRQHITRKGSPNKSVRKDDSPLKLASFNSTSSAKGEKSSTEKLIKQPIASAKNVDPKAKDRKQRNCKSGTHGLQKQAEKESPKTSKKDEMMKTQKLICEVIPKSNRAKRLLGAIAESLKKSQSKQTPKAAPEVKYHLRHLLLSCHSFRNLAYELFGIFLPKPTFFRSGFFDEHELGTDRLLLDCTEELARRKSREGKASIYQMVRERLANRLAYSSFGHLVEETSEWIEAGEVRPGRGRRCRTGWYPLHLGEGSPRRGVLNAVWGGGWDRRICEEEAEEAVVNVEEQIFSGLVFETAKELFLMKKPRLLRV
ncbi:hypothetical protein HPP92_023617 [Vanilla planifolia]|uniref:Uncharacterized protein n=1 Tax=Vanilla planifolia TaxID=51239 RepID=A0A835UAK4_VANPL|nr:hypothetical protein HPP92_023617 [Vanilla planifolia]